CLTPRVGAGFGNKMEAHVQPIAVALAMKCGRPVKLILSREEDFEMVRARHPYRIRMRTGARKDGTLVARECEVLLGCGAFADEQQIDEIALKLGIDPFEMRRRNILRKGDRWFVGPQIASNGLRECLDRVEAESRRREGQGAAGSDRSRGFGLAVTAHISGL